MKLYVIPIAIMFASNAFANQQQGKDNVAVDSLNPVNQEYLNSFCHYHPQSSLCYFTPNPSVAIPSKNPPLPTNIPSLSGGGVNLPPSSVCIPNVSCSLVVTGASQLLAAINGKQCGCEIILKSGNYAGNYTINKKCSASQPFILRSEIPLEATVNGKFSLIGSGIIIKSIKFTNHDYPVFLSGDQNMVIGNSFTGARGVHVKEARNFSIGHNSFTGNPQATRSDGVFIEISNGDNPLTQTGRVFRNLFTDTDNGASESHAIYVGNYPPQDYKNLNLLIEYNLYRGSKRRSIYTKGPGVTMRYNTILTNRGESGLRDGANSAVIGNYIEGSKHFAINGPNNIVQGNEFNGTEVNIFARFINNEDKGVAGSDASNTLYKCNSGRTIVGWTKGKQKVSPVRNVKVISHTGLLTKDFEQNTMISNESCSGVPKAIKLSPSSVGPSSFEQSCK